VRRGCLQPSAVRTYSKRATLHAAKGRPTPILGKGCMVEQCKSSLPDHNPQIPQVFQECHVVVTGNHSPFLLFLYAPCCLCKACSANSQHSVAPLFTLLRRQHDSVAMTSDMLACLFEGLVRTGQKSRGLPAGQHLSGTAIDVRQPLQCVVHIMVAAIHMCSLQRQQLPDAVTGDRLFTA